MEAPTPDARVSDIIGGLTVVALEAALAVHALRRAFAAGEPVPSINVSYVK